MNICFLSTDYPTANQGGGVGSQIRALARALRRAGHSVEVVALLFQAPSPPDVDEGVRVRWVRPGNLHWYVSKIPVLGPLVALSVRELEYGWALHAQARRLQRERPIDVIECSESGALFAALAPRGAAVVVRLHGEEYTRNRHCPEVRVPLKVRLSRLLQRAAIRRARLLVSPSAAYAREIERELGPDRPPIETVANCIDAGSFVLAPEGGPEPDLVLYAGRLEACKGIRVFLKAAALVLKERPQTRFLVAGADHPSVPRREVDRTIEALGLSRSLQRSGHLSSTRLMEEYRRASVFVMPSYYEIFGLIVLEAMANGAAVVAARTGVASEAIEHGVTGILVDPGDAQGLASGIVGLLRDPARARRMGAAARARALDGFDSESLLPANLAAYERARAAGRSRPE